MTFLSASPVFLRLAAACSEILGQLMLLKPLIYKLVPQLKAGVRYKNIYMKWFLKLLGLSQCKCNCHDLGYKDCAWCQNGWEFNGIEFIKKF